MGGMGFIPERLLMMDSFVFVSFYSRSLTVGGMGFIPERLLMMMMMMVMMMMNNDIEKL